ncbi:MAG: c-type cytochrome [Sandaracinaceae bacterium]|nr:c-type cytochrome [Sandaracinaceae bacterium]
MSDHAHSHGGSEGHEGHGEEHAHHGPEHYVRIWVILLVLLAISVLGPMLEIQVITLVTAFGIAVVKAFLVCKYFMHLDVQPKYVLYFLTVALAFMLLFFFAVAPDVMNHEGQNWTNVAAQEHIARALAEQGHGAAGEAGDFDAAGVFATTCGPCHGAGGAGDGAAAAALNPRPANFTDPAFWADSSRTHEHILTVIRDGGPAAGRSPLMAAFGAQFDEAQLEALARFVESLNPNAQ